MKLKSVSVITLLFVLSFSFNVLAQFGRMNAQERIQRDLEELKSRLSLTDIQFTKVDSLLKEQNSEMLKLRENNSGDRVSMRSAFMELRAKYDKKIEALLTDEQKKEYSKILEERRQRMQGMMRN